MNISFLNHCVFVKGSFPGKPDTESKLALEAHKLLFVFPFDIPLKQKKKQKNIIFKIFIAQNAATNQGLIKTYCQYIWKWIG